MDWFLYDGDFHHERVKEFLSLKLKIVFFFFDQKYVCSLYFRILLLVLEWNFLWNGYLLHDTVKPLNGEHLRVFKNLSVIETCPLLNVLSAIQGMFTLFKGGFTVVIRSYNNVVLYERNTFIKKQYLMV